MEVEPLFGGHPLVLSQGIVRIDVLEDQEDIEALVGEVHRHVHKLPASVGQAVAQDGLEGFGQVAGQGIAHLDRRTKLRGPLP